ncbi:MAG TPA: hypothetical protein VGE29_01030, partial [Prosthecobacter sp.]
ITQTGNQWTVTSLVDGADGTTFRFNGGAEQTSLSFAAPLSLKANLGAGHDEMVLVDTDIAKAVSINMGDGNDTLDFTGTKFQLTASVLMGNGDDYFTAGDGLTFNKGLTVDLGKGANTFDINTSTLLSNGNITASASGSVLEEQNFLLQAGTGTINGSLTLKTTTASNTNFEIGGLVTDSLVVTKAMTLQSAAGTDKVTLRGDLEVGGLLSLKLGHGNNRVVTADLDNLTSTGLTYTGGTGSDDFFIEASTVTVKGNFTFSAGAGSNVLEVATTGYFDVTKSLNYTGGKDYDELTLRGPDVFVSGTVNMAASHGDNVMAMIAGIVDVGAIKFTAGNGYDDVDIGHPEGSTTGAYVASNVNISTGAGAAEVYFRNGQIVGNVSVATNAGLAAQGVSFIDDVILLETNVGGSLMVSMTGQADSVVEIRNGFFNRNVIINTGNGHDVVYFDTDTEVPTNGEPVESEDFVGVSEFYGYVRINLGAGDDTFYTGNDPSTPNVGNTFFSYVDVYGGTGFDVAEFADSRRYNNGFQRYQPWVSSIEDLT